MSKHPVGIFDSGIGGLSVLKEIQTILPYEDVVYVADSTYAPYGNKSHKFILQRCEQLTQFLIEQHARAIVIACNTATAVAVSYLRQKFEIPIIAMEPGVKPAIAATHSGVVGVLATENTLASEQFTKLVHRFAENVEVICQPCPGLVEQIETGKYDDAMTYQLIEKYTQPLLSAGTDTIVLGCTHYPLIREQIKQVVGDKIHIIETGSAVALQLERVLQNDVDPQDHHSCGTITAWSSGETAHLKETLLNLSGRQIDVSPLRLPDTLIKQE
ncbi:MAG: glutamate racemase [Gammaproteobacteria bacterium]|nr:glutamate racemase [Gammaproteobacteria bacterium]